MSGVFAIFKVVYGVTFSSSYIECQRAKSLSDLLMTDCEVAFIYFESAIQS